MALVPITLYIDEDTVKHIAHLGPLTVVQLRIDHSPDCYEPTIVRLECQRVVLWPEGGMAREQTLRIGT